MTTDDPYERRLRRPKRDPRGVVEVLDRAIARAADEGLIDVAFATTDSPVGSLLLAATDAGLVRVAFEREDARSVLQDLAARIGPRVVTAPRRLDEARRELDEYFSGRRDRFELAIDWRLTAGFRKTVLEHLVEHVPYGRTVSYQHLASLVGNPSAARAVGTAMATNPIPIVVPCHRVLRSGGQLGGYGGGLPAKELLLHLEAGEPSLF